jgi:transposase-like protein
LQRRQLLRSLALKWTLKTGQQFKLAPNQKGHVRMGEAKRKTYTASFKAKVGLEAIRGVKTVNEIGQEHGVHPVQVGQWKKEILEQAGTLFETKRGRQKVDDQAEPERLYSEIGRLKMELDWLKKKSGLSL